MKRSDSVTNLVAALAKAQKGIENAKRDHIAKVTPRDASKQGYTFAYADLASVMDVVRDPLADNGLSIIQIPSVQTGDAGTTVSVTATLFHESGEWIETDPLTARIVDAFPQTIGSGITYLRRYQIGPLLGVAFEADDDGNAATGNQAETGERKREYLPNCPQCGKHDVQKGGSVIKGNAQYGSGLVCWKNKGGCGHTWQTAEHPFTGDKAAGPANQPRTEAPPKNGNRISPGEEMGAEMDKSREAHQQGLPLPDPAAAPPPSVERNAASMQQSAMAQQTAAQQTALPRNQQPTGPSPLKQAHDAEKAAQNGSSAGPGQAAAPPAIEQLKNYLRTMVPEGQKIITGQVNRIISFATNRQCDGIAAVTAKGDKYILELLENLRSGQWTLARVDEELKAQASSAA